MNHAWVSAYFVQKQGHAGVSLTFTKGELGDRLFNALLNEREKIDQELGFTPEWKDGGDGGKHWVSTSREYGKGKAKAPEIRDEIKEFMADALNRYVNAFRPRLKRLTDKD